MILLKKAARSIWRGKSSYMACVVLLGAGIAMFVAFNQMLTNLATATEGLYSARRFADGFAAVSAIPLPSVDRLGAMDGIDRVQATIVADARVDKPGSHKIITLRLNSFDATDTERLNDFEILSGAAPSGVQGEDGLLMSKAFADANSLTVGDSVSLILGGSRTDMIITALVDSPEYIYMAQESNGSAADKELLGYGFVDQSTLAKMTGLEGMATNLAFTLDVGVTVEDIRARMEEALEQYGLNYLVERKDQPSNFALQREIAGLGNMATAIPAVFVTMAVIILYVMLKRIIEQERGQIGTLKAMGFSDAALIAHYMGYGGITGLAGGLFGLGLSLPITRYITGMYLQLFSLPDVASPLAGELASAGMMLSMAAGLSGAFFGARNTLRFSPSEAMRAAAPPTVVSGDLVARLPFARKLLDTHGIMALRNITRSWFRSIFVLMGICFAFALIAYMVSYSDTFGAIMLKQFTRVELYNIKVSLSEPTSPAEAMTAARRLPDIRSAETLLELPVEAKKEHLRRSFTLTAMEDSGGLYRVYDSEKDASLPLPENGVVISGGIAEALRAKPGDLLTITTPYTGDREYSLPVASVIEFNIGTGAYIRQEVLWQLMDTLPTVNSIIMLADNTDAVKEELSAADVAAIADREEARAVYEEILSGYAPLITMLELAGIFIAYAIITNTASISLSERKREYATMRVLGMHPAEISRVISFEYWVLSVLAIPPGVALTQLIKRLLAESMRTDSFSMPVEANTGSFVIAAILCFAAVLASNLNARRMISRFDMVEVLKERE